jgi:hypothetical protein
MIAVLMMILLLAAYAHAQEEVGVRPYELDRAGRTEDDHPPLIDFEDLTGWHVEAANAQATFERSREQQIWGDYVGKLTYRERADSEAEDEAPPAWATGSSPEVRVLPPAPVPINQPCDAVTMWVYGNTWGYRYDATTPQVTVTVVFDDAQGNELSIDLIRVRWQEWFLCHRRLTPEQIERVRQGASLKYFRVTGGRNEEDRVIYFDNLAVFVEQFPPLQFRPRPQRGIDMFPGQTVGTNTGPGKLPFPNRPQTILPDNLTEDFTTSLAAEEDAFVFSYQGGDGKLTYRLQPATGTWGDITARWEGRGDLITPCVEGGIYLQTPEGPKPHDRMELLSAERKGEAVETRWRLSAGEVSAEVTYTYRLWNKSLVIDTIAPGGQVGEVRYGYALGLDNPRLVTNPYCTYGGSRPAVAISGPADAPLFLTGNTDWYLSNASEPWADNEVKEGRVRYNGGTRYIAKTNGERNDCYERFFITLTPRYEETLPTIANPTSQWKHVTGTRVWRPHGAGNREGDKAFWRKVHRYGVTEMVVTDHETMWRDGGESFTFRTRAAPGKGDDQGAYDYARVMQDELGYVYGPYNNFTDFAPVNEFWSFDLISRLPDNQLRQAWMRCYAPKPARAVEYCEMLAPQIEEKFRFSTAYCDVHTAVTPWSRTDYDYRVPGGGTFAATYYSYGEIMLLQKAAWDGPVYSEGNNHWLYCGLTDGNYGQDQNYKPATSPWLVDFDLRKLHDLCCNFGMGMPSMFYSRDHDYGSTPEQVDASIDRFLAATVAFGHTGYLVRTGGEHMMLRSYYMLQQLHSSYALASADEIRYTDANGNLLDTTTGVASGVHARSQMVTRYDNGCVTVVNGHPQQRMQVEAYGRKLDLPPNGYAGWTEDGSLDVLSADPDGHRCDYAVTPAYLYVDGRGKFMRFERAAGDGIGICRTMPEGRFEVIPYQEAECGFAVNADSARALDEAGNEIGPAEVRQARGLTYVMPVENAFSYMLAAGEPAAAALDCERDEVVAGEREVVRGQREHELRIPADARPGERIWQQFEGQWMDFTVVPLAYAKASLGDPQDNKENVVTLQLTSNLAGPEDVEVRLGGTSQTVRLEPGVPAALEFDLGPPAHEAAEMITVELRADEVEGRLEYGMRIINDMVQVAPVPTQYQVGMALRGEAETSDLGTTRAYVSTGTKICDGISKEGFTMHPPWVGGVGYVFVLYDPVALPVRPQAAFRASVGKGDGSDPGDGILYKLVVVDEQGEETVIGQTLVTEHEWLELKGDLSPWAGNTVRLKLIADVGEEDNSSGDWAGAADMRIESLDRLLTRILDTDTETYRREPPPFPVAGLTAEDLRAARTGVLHYDGIGLSGTGDAYGSFAVLNGVQLGNMAPAGGGEREGVWVEAVSVPLTPEAIQTLDFRNEFVLENPRKDWFKVRRFWLELELADGRKCSSYISAAVFTQPPDWPYAEGIGVPFTRNITVDIWFER